MKIKVIAIILTMLIFTSAFVLANIINDFDDYSVPLDISFYGNANASLNISIFKDANVISGIINLTWSPFYNSLLYEYSNATDSVSSYTHLSPWQSLTIGSLGLNETIKLLNISAYIGKTGSPPSGLTIGVKEFNGEAPVGDYICYKDINSNQISNSLTWINVSFQYQECNLTNDKLYVIQMNSSGDSSNTYLWRLGYSSYTGGRSSYSFAVDQTFMIYGYKNYSQPSNFSLDIGQYNVIRFEGIFSSYQITNLSARLNSSLNLGACDCLGCSLLGNNCNIPFIFHSDSSGKINIDFLNITWIENVKPNLTIIQPKGSKDATEVSYNVSVSDNYLTSLCTYWVTRGASIEIANTSIACGNSMTGNLYVSSIGTNYTFHFFVNDTSGNSNYSNSSFAISSTAVYITPPSGGGGGSSIEEDNQQLVEQVCDAYPEQLKSAWIKFKEESTWENFKILWTAFWNQGLCDSAGSIVPRSQFYSE